MKHVVISGYYNIIATLLQKCAFLVYTVVIGQVFVTKLELRLSIYRPSRHCYIPMHS